MSEPDLTAKILDCNARTRELRTRRRATAAWKHSKIKPISFLDAGRSIGVARLGELRLSDAACPEGSLFAKQRALNLPEAASVAPKMGREPRRRHFAFTHRCFVDALAGLLL